MISCQIRIPERRWRPVTSTIKVIKIDANGVTCGRRCSDGSVVSVSRNVSGLVLSPIPIVIRPVTVTTFVTGWRVRTRRWWTTVPTRIVRHGTELLDLVKPQVRINLKLKRNRRFNSRTDVSGLFTESIKENKKAQGKFLVFKSNVATCVNLYSKLDHSRKKNIFILCYKTVLLHIIFF